MSGQALARAAAALVGARFRLHGRDPATGLDCIGVLAASLTAIGRPASLPKAYRLRTRDPGDVHALAHACGLRPASAGQTCAGDVLLVRVSACQFHLLIALGAAAFVHAHAGLRRIVRHDGPIAWPVIGHWHLPDEGSS